MATVVEILAKLRADASGFTKGFNEATRSVSSFERELDKAKRNTDVTNTKLAALGSTVSSMGAGLSSAGRKMTMGVTLPLVGIGAMAVKTAGDFESTMNVLQVMANVPQGDMEKLSKLALKMGADTVFSANEAAQAMLELGRAGVSVADISGGALQGALALAATENMDLATAAGIAANAMNAFQLSGKNVGMIADTLAGGANASSASVMDLADGLKYASATANSMGYTINDTVGALAMLNNAGIDSTTAGTTLNQMMLRLTTTSGMAAKAAKQLGVSFFDSSGKALPLTKIIDNLKVATRGMGDEEKMAALKRIFGAEAMRGVLVMMNQGSAKLKEYTDATKKNGSAQQLADARMKGMKGALEQLRGSIETAALALGNAMEPAVIAVAGAIKTLADLFTNLPAPVQKGVAVLLAVAAATGPVAFGLGKVITMTGGVMTAFATGGASGSAMGKGLVLLSKAFGPLISAARAATTAFVQMGAALLANPITWIVIGVVAVIAALVLLYKKVDWFRNAVNAAWAWIKSATAATFGAVVSALSAAWNAIVAVIKPAVEIVWNVIQVAWKAIGLIIGVQLAIWITLIKAAWAVIKATVIPAVKAIWNIIKTVFGIIAKVIGTYVGIWRKIIVGAWNLIYNAVKGPVTAIWKLVSGAFSKVVDVISGFVGRAASAVSGVVKAIVTPIANIGSTVIEYGKNIVQGLWNGIVSMGSWLIDKITGWVKNVIPGPIAKALGINSPSRETTKQGVQIAKGLQAGMDSEKGRTAKKAAQLARATTKAITAEQRRWAGQNEMAIGLVRRQRENRNLSKSFSVKTDNKRFTPKVAREASSAIKAKASDILNFKKDISGNIASYASISSGFNSSGAGFAPMDVLSNMRSRLAQIQQFGSQIEKLRKMGLANSVIQDIIGQGPEGGTQLAQALLDLGQSGVAQANALSRQTQMAASQVGSSAAAAQFGFTSAQAKAMSGVTVASGAVQINISGDMTKADQKELRATVDLAIKKAMKELANESRANR